MEVVIEGGCTHIGDGVWTYRWNDSSGVHSTTFVAGDFIPTIGDLIVDGELVPLVDYKINTDTSKWRQHYENEWPKDTY